MVWVHVLIRDDILYRYTVEVIDSDVEDVMWVKMSSTQDEKTRLMIAVCYIPPEASSSGRDAEEMMQLLVTPIGMVM